MTEDNALLVVIDTDDPPPADPRAVCRPTAVVLPAEGRWLLRTLVERLHLPPEQVLFVALERLYVQYPTVEMLDGGPVEYVAQDGDAMNYELPSQTCRWCGEPLRFGRCDVCDQGYAIPQKTTKGR